MPSRRALVPAALALLALPVLLASPPATAQEAAWRQLRLRAQGAHVALRPGAVVAAERLSTLPAGRRVVRDANLYRDQRRTIHPGQSGLLVHRLPAQVGADGLLRRLAAYKKRLRAARPAEVASGTIPVHYLRRGGVTYRYMRQLRLVATAYNASYAQNGPWGPTAALGGVPLVRGMAAVDPSVIPLGTRLYVEGYGPALAADTGSAIVGDRIDLFMDKGPQATSAFGIRTLNVYILGPQSVS